MDTRTLLTATGAGVTSGLLIAVAIIELLDTEFSAIVGLPIGMLGAAVVFVGLWLRGDELRPGTRRAVAAYATFGLVVLAVLGLRYAHVGRGVLTFEVVVGSGLAAVVVVYVGLRFRDRGRA